MSKFMICGLVLQIIDHVVIFEETQIGSMSGSTDHGPSLRILN